MRLAKFYNKLAFGLYVAKPPATVPAYMQWRADVAAVANAIRDTDETGHFDQGRFMVNCNAGPGLYPVRERTP